MTDNTQEVMQRRINELEMQVADQQRQLDLLYFSFGGFSVGGQDLRTLVQTMSSATPPPYAAPPAAAAPPPPAAPPAAAAATANYVTIQLVDPGPIIVSDSDDDDEDEERASRQRRHLNF